MLIRLANIIGLVALSSTSCAEAQTAPNAPAACAVATARVTAQRQLPASHVAFCEHIPKADSPDGYYLMALRAHCSEELCGSTNMGWFVVRKATGDVFEWDVAESKLGQPVAERP